MGGRRCATSLMRVLRSCMYERAVHRRTGRFALALALMLCACRQPVAAPPAARALQTEAPAPAPVADDQPAPRDPFALDEPSDDPGAALESMKHNCCDEMPAHEIREHVGDTRAPTSK